MLKLKKLIDKNLSKGSNYCAGRNNKGLITVKHRVVF